MPAQGETGRQGQQGALRVKPEREGAVAGISLGGITPSVAFIAERFNRTLKEQAIYGRMFRVAEDVRQVVRDFVALYNRQRAVEKRL